MRIGIASIMQETNTFAVRPTLLSDFTLQIGDEVGVAMVGANLEVAGAAAAVVRGGASPVPLVRAWAMPGGRVDGAAFSHLRDLLADSLQAAGPLDGLVLSLHGAMAAVGEDDADAMLIETARRIVGDTPIAVCLDLHANLTGRLAGAADVLTAYHTDPHVDMGATGARAADLLLRTIRGDIAPATALTKRSMIVPAEAMNTTTGPMARLRIAAYEATNDVVLDVCLFPVQPWLDVPELGFGVVVTTDGDPDLASAEAERIADLAWADRESFIVPNMATPAEAVERARRARTKPFVVAESADAPTAGAAGDSPAMVAAILADGADLAALVPIVDPPAVAACHAAGVGAQLSIDVGAAIDHRWWDPVPVTGMVAGVGDGSYRLEGASFTGMQVSMGRFAVIDVGRMSLLLSERAPFSSDPATFRHAGLDPDTADLVVVRSCSDYRPNYPASESVALDVPGPATPRLESLTFTRAPRPLWPIDR